MNYPLISDYIEAIKSAKDNFEELRYLRPVLDDDGLPVMSAGGFSVVFKMKDERNGKLYALKCFTKEQEGRAEAYHQITEELKKVDSPYLVSFRYLDKELFVDTAQTDETEFPVLLMDWVEGKTLDKYLRENLNDKYALEMLAYRFSQLAQWLIPQSFAHGDLKPDNIIVREDGSLVLVDYDGMYVPAMKGQKARELSSPDFRHPQRTKNDFDEHIDDFPVVSILLSLKAISNKPQLLSEYAATDTLLISEKDYYSIEECKLFKNQLPSNDKNFNKVYSLFIYVYSNNGILDIPIIPFLMPSQKNIDNENLSNSGTQLVTVIKRLESAELSANFGDERNGVRNYGVKCGFSDGNSEEFAVVGEQPLFSATIIMPQRIYDAKSGNAERLDYFKSELNKALADGTLKLYGHLVAVSECNNEGHKRVKNTVNGHVIETFAQAMGKDDHEAAVNLCRRGLAKRIAKKAFVWDD